MKYIIIFILFLGVIQACKKPYDDPPTMEGPASLVVEGMITNDPPPYTVKLTWSTSYQALVATNPPVVPNAMVTITDDIGNTALCG